MAWLNGMKQPENILLGDGIAEKMTFGESINIRVTTQDALQERGSRSGQSNYEYPFQCTFLFKLILKIDLTKSMLISGNKLVHLGLFEP